MFMPGIHIKGELPFFFDAPYGHLWEMPEEVFEAWLRKVPKQYHDQVRRDYWEEVDWHWQDDEKPKRKNDEINYENVIFWLGVRIWLLGWWWAFTGCVRSTQHCRELMDRKKKLEEQMPW